MLISRDKMVQHKRVKITNALKKVHQSSSFNHVGALIFVIEPQPPDHVEKSITTNSSMSISYLKLFYHGLNLILKCQHVSGKRKQCNTRFKKSQSFRATNQMEDDLPINEYYLFINNIHWKHI